MAVGLSFHQVSVPAVARAAMANGRWLAGRAAIRDCDGALIREPGFSGVTFFKHRIGECVFCAIFLPGTLANLYEPTALYPPVPLWGYALGLCPIFPGRQYFPSY